MTSSNSNGFESTSNIVCAEIELSFTIFNIHFRFFLNADFD